MMLLASIRSTMRDVIAREMSFSAELQDEPKKQQYLFVGYCDTVDGIIQATLKGFWALWGIRLIIIFHARI